MRKLTAIMCAILVFTTTTIPVYAEDEIYIEPGQNVSENMESENMESENMESENMESENMESENMESEKMESEKMESENMESENMESVDESEDAGESDETGEPADEYGAAPLAEETHEVSYGDFTLKASDDIILNTDYNTGTSNTLTITSSKPVTISMAASGSTTTQYKIAVESPDGANITLSGVSIKAGSGCAFEIKASSGSVTVTLDGDNTLQSESSYAGLQKGNNALLTMNGSGSLKATGGASGGAGIGGGVSGSGSYITIESGTIEATGGNNGGAGIGGGYLGSGTDITINGGNITAKGGNSGGAGIGGGSIGSGTGITISGSATVYANGGQGSAGIGGGQNGSGTDITINSGTEITANGGQGGSGIGGGQSGSGTRITINGGKIKAIGGSNSSVGGAGIGGAGIGGGSSGSGTGITISGSATVYATGGNNGGAGIGGGKNGSGESITISGGIVTANGGTNGAGIGGGLDGNGTNIEINGSAAVYANCKDEKGEDLENPIAGNGAGIGGGGGNGFNGSKAGDGDNITITGSGTVIAKGAGYGAGIGGGGNSNGDAGNGTNITIDLRGGTVEAKGSVTGGCGAGIGGGGAQANSGYGESISISGSGTVEAKGGTDSNSNMTGAAIGGSGNGGDSKGITISGSVTVKAESGVIGGGRGWGGDVTGSGGAITIDDKFSGTIDAGTIGGTNCNVTINGGGTITATGTIGGSGSSTVNIEGKNAKFYPWVEAGSITRTNTDDYDKCVVFDDAHKKTYDTGYTADGLVYGDTFILTTEHTIKDKTLGVQSGTTFITNDGDNKLLTLGENSALYLEEGANKDIDTYKFVNNNGGQILHEDASTYDSNSLCEICGMSGPHSFLDDWEYNKTHHWHECIGKDCSVYGRNEKCELANSQKLGFGRHIFREEKTSWGGVNYICEVCKYSTLFPVTLAPIEIYKVDGNGNALEGAAFGLYSDADCKNMVDEATSVEVEVAGETKAVASFVGDKIELDTTYYIREIKAPIGYKKSDDKYEVTVGPYGTVTYGVSDTTPSKCMNTKIVIDPIKIYKEDGNGNALAGAVFGLYSDEDCGNKVDEATSVEVNIDGKTKAAASFAGDNIEPDKTYYIREITAPTGYTKSDDKYKVTVDSDGKVTYSIVDPEDKIITDPNGIPKCINTKIPDPIQIYKVDGGGKALAGAKFRLYSDVSFAETARVGEEVTAAETRIGEETKAVASFTAGIEVGNTYYIRETEAPDGYKASDKVYRAVVDADGKVTYSIVDPEGNVITALKDIPKCINTKIIPDPIQVYKVDGGGKALAGAKFRLYSDAGCAETARVGAEVTAAETIIEGKTKAVASFTAGIEVGKTYYIRETKAPDGYSASDKVYKAVVDADGKVTYSIVDPEGNVIEDLEDIPECVNTKIPDPIQIYKVDGGGKALAGAKFRLYSDVSFAETARVGEEVTAAETTIDGKTKAVASFTAGIEVGNTYYIRETEAPDGYKASDKVYKAVVDADGKVTYSIVDPEGNVIEDLDDIPECVNTKIPDPIQIYKVDGGGKALAGAKFRLYSDVSFAETAQVGEELTAAETTIDGKTKAVASFTAGIEVGRTYYIRETEAPDGYRASDEVYKAVVGADGKVTYSIVDSEGNVITALNGIPECVNTKIIPDPVKIILEDGETGAPLAGAEFGIYSDKQCTEANRIAVGTTKIDTDSASDTYNKAVVSFKTELGRAYCIIELDTTYYIKETQAPEGYIASEEVYKVVVGIDGKVSYGTAGSEETKETVPVCKNYAVKITYTPPSITKVEETGNPIVLSPKTGDTGEAGAAGIAILSGIAWAAFLVGVLQKRKRKKELFL